MYPYIKCFQIIQDMAKCIWYFMVPEIINDNHMIVWWLQITFWNNMHGMVNHNPLSSNMTWTYSSM